MTRTIHPITRERHAGKKWMRFSDVSFASSVTVVPLTITEVLSAARAFPLGFIELGGRLCLSAIFGLKPDQNLFIGANGRWLGQYLPTTFQYYPFSLGQTDGQNLALCVDEASGLVKDVAVGEEGFPFFDAEGNPTADTKRMLDNLGAARRGFEVTERATASILSKNLLEPWPITYKEEAGERRIDGIRRVNEPALNALGAEDLASLRDAGGLAIAYCQLFSMGNIAALGQLFGAHAAANRQRMTVPQHSFVPKEDDSLKIDWEAFLKDN